MLDEKYIVEKSKALVWAQFQDYSPGELKILDTYLSRIDARNPDSSLVTFTKKEYEDVLDESEIKVFKDFISRAKELNIIELSSSKKQGVYKFTNNLYPIYFYIQSLKDKSQTELI